jgi:hypothetical protein
MEPVEWLSVEAAAKQLRVAPMTLDGRRTSSEDGRSIRIRQEDLDAFVDAQKVIPGSLSHLYESGAPQDRNGDD